jgi:hypothetical protein
LFQLGKTTFSMPGGHLMELLYSRLVYEATKFFSHSCFSTGSFNSAVSTATAG